MLNYNSNDDHLKRNTIATTTTFTSSITSLNAPLTSLKSYKEATTSTSRDTHKQQPPSYNQHKLLSLIAQAPSFMRTTDSQQQSDKQN